MKENECSENDPSPSHNEAFEYFETATKWLERQKNADPIQLTYLRRIRNIAGIEKNVFFKASNNRKLFYLNYNLWSTENDKKRKRKF